MSLIHVDPTQEIGSNFPMKLGEGKMKKTLSILLLVFLAYFIINCQEKAVVPSSQKPESDAILKHAKALYTSLAFYAGMQLDIFTMLDAKPMNPEEAAAVIGTKPEFAKRLLFALAACDLLEIEEGVFSNTDEAGTYLVKGKPDYLGNHVLVNPYLQQYMISGGSQIPESIRKGQASQFIDYSEVSYENWLEIFRGTMPVAVKAGEALAAKYDFSRFSTIADIGGASGGLIAALIKAYPHLDATVTDLASITPVSRTLLQEQGVSQIGVENWDVLEGPSEVPYDAVVLRALIQVLTPDQAYQAMINIGKSVNPGGAIYILGHIMDDTRISPPEEVVWYLLNLNWEDRAGFYAEEDFRFMLEEAGFGDIQRDILPNGDGVIFAIKASK